MSSEARENVGELNVPIVDSGESAARYREKLPATLVEGKRVLLFFETTSRNTEK